MNHFKDEEDQWEKLKLILHYINPQAAAEMFDAKPVEKTESTEDFMLDQIGKDLKGKYTSEELKAIFADPKHFSELDTITKVE